MPQTHRTQASGVVIPRYRAIGGDEIVRGDRIDKGYDGVLYLASGARVILDDDVLKNGPSNTGDYVIFGEQGLDGEQKTPDRLMRGDEFLAKFANIPHGLDVPCMSAALAPQAGSVNKPVNQVDPEHPATADQVPVEPSNADAVTHQMDVAAQEHAAYGEKKPDEPTS